MLLTTLSYTVMAATAMMLIKAIHDTYQDDAHQLFF
ncbi:MAG: hypothetical protein RL172_593 [Bacteroidota bacterium]|jgi:hypothetical protein